MIKPHSIFKYYYPLAKKTIMVSMLIMTFFLSTTSQAEDSMLSKKPYFTFRIEANDALFESKVNGILLEENFNGTQLIVEHPVNHYMRSGKNRIGFQLYPEDDGKFAQAKLTVSLFVNQDGAPDSNKKLIGQVTFSASEFTKNKQPADAIKTSMPAVNLDSTNEFLADDEGDVIVHSPRIEKSKIVPDAIFVYQDIELETPFPLWGFFKGDKLNFPDDEDSFFDNIEQYKQNLINPLYREHELLYILFKSKDLTKILPLFAERNREMDIAMYLPEGNYEHQLTSALQEDFANKDSYLKLVEAKFAKPTVSDGKELIRLGSPDMIRFADDENSIYDKYPIWFYKKDGKWIISR